MKKASGGGVIGISFTRRRRGGGIMGKVFEYYASSVARRNFEALLRFNSSNFSRRHALTAFSDPLAPFIIVSNCLE